MFDILPKERLSGKRFSLPFEVASEHSWPPYSDTFILVMVKVVAKCADLFFTVKKKLILFSKFALK